MWRVASSDSRACAAIKAIEAGDVDGLRRLLADQPWLATARIVRTRPRSAGTQGEHACGHDGRESRTLLHVLTDWPGHRPRGAETVAVLVGAGADVEARFEGPHEERPLHWAASCDDVSVLDALLDHGADIEAPGAVIGGGTAVADAVAFAQWNAARRLVARGARTNVWQAAALGLLDRVRAHFEQTPSSPMSAAGHEEASPGEVTHAFWCACHGGQLEVARYLLDRGADRAWIGYDHLTPIEAARRSNFIEVVQWLEQG